MGINKQKGQAVLFVVVAATVGLAVVAGVASRTVTSIVRVTESDISTRAKSVAEAGAEKFLRYSMSDLSFLMTSCPASKLQNNDLSSASINSQCKVALSNQVVSGNQTNITQTAYIGIEPIPSSDNPTVYSKTVKSGKQVSLQLGSGDTVYPFVGSKVKIEISSAKSSSAAYLYNFYYYYLDSNGVLNYGVDRGAVCTNPNCSGALTFNDSSFTDSTYRYRNTLDFDSLNTKGISASNIFPVYITGVVYGNNSNTQADEDSYTITFTSLQNSSGTTPNFPAQGYKIVSVGVVSGVSDSRSAQKKVTVKKMIPSNFFGFDYAVSSGANIQNTQN